MRMRLARPGRCLGYIAATRAIWYAVTSTYVPAAAKVATRPSLKRLIPHRTQDSTATRESLNASARAVPELNRASMSGLAS